jgi:hypothetical protein
MTTIYGPFEIGDRFAWGNHSSVSGTAAFTNSAGVATDPTAVTLRIERPDGTQLVYGWPDAGEAGTLLRESVGRVYVERTLDQAGTWWGYLASTGSAESAALWGVYVSASRVAGVGA